MQSQSRQVSRRGARRQQVAPTTIDGPQHTVDEPAPAARPPRRHQLDRGIDGGEVGHAVEKQQRVDTQPQRRAYVRV